MHLADVANPFLVNGSRKPEILTAMALALTALFETATNAPRTAHAAYARTNLTSVGNTFGVTVMTSQQIRCVSYALNNHV